MHFSREIYGESQVLEVQVAFDFVKLKQAQRKVLAAQMGREHCEELLRKTGERPLTTVSTNKLSPCCHCCGASHVDGIEYFTEEEEDGKVEADQQRQKLKSLGIAFVTFENAKIVQRYNNSKLMEASVTDLLIKMCADVGHADFLLLIEMILRCIFLKKISQSNNSNIANILLACEQALIISVQYALYSARGKIGDKSGRAWLGVWH